VARKLAHSTEHFQLGDSDNRPPIPSASPDSVISSSVINPAGTLNWRSRQEQENVFRQETTTKVFVNQLALTLAAIVCAANGVLAGGHAGAAEPVRWHTAEGVRRQLDQPLSLSWSGAPAREALLNLSRSQRVPIVLDRRVDPGQELELTLNDVSLRDALAQIAAKLHVGVGQAGPVMYLGPHAAAERLQTLVELRRHEINRLPLETRRLLLALKPVQWNALCAPRELLAETARDYGIRIESLEDFPHDLWPAGDLPPIGLAERVSLVAVQFDLTFELSADGQWMRLVPMPKRVVMENSYRVENPAAVIGRLRDVLKHSELIASDRAITVRGPAEELAMMADLLSGKKVRRSNVTPGKTVYQLNIAMPVGRLIRELAAKLGLELQLDEAAVRQAGVNLEQDVKVSLKDASEDELLKAALDPAGLTFQRSGKTLVVRPK
jgi:hypothetical protein